MRRRFYSSLAMLTLIATPRLARASDPSASSFIAVVFDASAADLPQREIRAAVGQELQRSVRAEAEPGTAALFILRDAEGRLVLRYRPPPGDLERTISVSNAGGDTARQIASVAKSLLTGASTSADGATSGSEGRPSASASQHAPVSAPATLPLSAFYVRLSFSAGFGDAIYVYRDASRAILESGFNGPHLDIHAAFGHQVASGLVMGGELGAIASGPLSNQGQLAGHAIGPFALRLQIGPFVDYYPNVQGKLHLQAGAGFARYLFQYSVASCASSCTGVSIDGSGIGQPLWGGSAYLGIGYDLGARPGGAGLFARTSFGYFADERVSMWPLEVSLGATFAWF